MKRTPIKKVSDKMKKQLILEKRLKLDLWIKQDGRCADCGNWLEWRSAKHEIIFRSQGGDPLDEKNCVILCGKCHSRVHPIHEV